MKILAVDDDELIIELLIESLGQEGFTDITPAYSGLEALDLIESLDAGSLDEEVGTFDCFLFDIQMPGMTGIELCRKVRSLPQYGQTPIVMVTTLSDRKHMEQAFMAGATDYVTKPFDQMELATRIRLANMLVNEQRRGLQAYFLASALEAGNDEDKTAVFQAPVAVQGIDNVVDFTILENYLIRLTKKGLYETVAIAFRDAGANDAFRGRSTESFYERLQKIARLTTECLGNGEYLLSYFGSGVFVCVMDRKNYHIDDDFVDRLQELAVEEEILLDDGSPAIVVGDPVENASHRRNDVHSILLDAISSAISKSARGKQGRRKLRKLAPRATKFKSFQEN